MKFVLGIINSLDRLLKNSLHLAIIGHRIICTEYSFISLAETFQSVLSFSPYHFDVLGRYIVESEQGREITKEETHAILKQSAESGLVHAISNWRDKPDTICNCCSCCCMFLDGYHRLRHPEGTNASSYIVQIEESTCKACALCVKRCPMDALQFKVNEKAGNKFGKAAFPVTEPCIGCGVCVHKCPTDSLKFVARENESSPPQNVKEYMMNFIKDKKKAQMKS